MIYGVGTDIVQVSRFEKWAKNQKMISRFFNECEIVENAEEKNEQFLREHYASRFAAKEALLKALGTGFAAVSPRDFGIVKDKLGKPEFCLGENTRKLIDKHCGMNWNIKISISHEKEYAVAFALIEIAENGGTSLAAGAEFSKES